MEPTNFHLISYLAALLLVTVSIEQCLVISCIILQLHRWYGIQVMRWIYESSRRRTGNREDKWECIRNQEGNEPISSISTSKKHFTQMQQVVEIKDLGKKGATELLYMTKQFDRREEHKRPESCTSTATLISASSIDTTSKYHATWQLETFISLLEI